MRNVFKIVLAAALVCVGFIPQASAKTVVVLSSGSHHSYHSHGHDHWRGNDRWHGRGWSNSAFFFGTPFYPEQRPVYVNNYYGPPVAPTYVNYQEGTYNPAQGTYCREYQRQVLIGGRLQQSYGSACLMPDGSWQVMN
jgi:hypothetical protein